MPRVLIIGYGNPLRCDDGLAWRAIEMLAQQTGLPPELELIARHQLTPELTFLASQAETVVFLDAGDSAQASEIKCEPVLPARHGARFSHDCSPAAILALANDLYGKAPQALMISLRGECFEHGESLSTKVIEILPEFVRIVAALVGKSVATDPVLQETSHG
jgi:hydrogenase maturation protease